MPYRAPGVEHINNTFMSEFLILQYLFLKSVYKNFQQEEKEKHQNAYSIFL